MPSILAEMPPSGLGVLAWLTAIAALIRLLSPLYRHHRETRLAARRWRERPSMSDIDFLKACVIPDEPLEAQVALVARRAIARLGTVPVGTIRPDDTFVHDLMQLPFWDSLDWMGLIIEVEQPFEGKVVLDYSFIDEAVKLAGGRRLKLRVKHVVQATALAASYRSEKPVIDEDR